MQQQKSEVINDAYSQMRISGLTVNPTPEELQIALTRLEAMMHQLASRNIDVDYNFEDTPDPSSLTNVEPYAWQMLSTNLAVRLIPDFNKQVPQTLLNQATASLSTVSGVSAKKFTQETQYPRRQARGSGNTLRYNRWNRFYRNPPFAPSNSATNYVNPGDINDYIESFNAYLNDGETINTFSLEADTDLTILSATIGTDELDINYTVEVSDNPTNTTTGFQRVVIQITTSDNRITSRKINFQINTQLD